MAVLGERARVQAPVYQRRQDPFTGGIQAPRLPAVSGLAVGAEAFAGALQQTAQASQAIAGAELRKADLRGRAYKHNSMARLEERGIPKYRELIETAPADGRGVKDALKSWLQEERAAILEEAPAYYDTSELHAELDAFESRLTLQADGFERERALDWQTTNEREASDAWTRIITLDPGRYQEALQRRLAEIDGLDLPEPARQALHKETRQSFAVANVQGMLLDDPQAALDWLERGETADLPPEQLPTLMHKARAAVEQQQREAAAAGEKAAKRAGEAAGVHIFELGIDGPAGGEALPGGGRRAPLGAMLAQAREIEDPTARKAAEGRIRELFTADEQARKDAQRQARETAYRFVNEGGRVADLPDELVAALDPTEIAGLEVRMRQVTAGVEPVTDWQAYVRLEEMSDAELAEQVMLEWQPYLSNEHFEHFVARKAKILQGEATDDPASLQQQMAIAADRHGLEGEARGLFYDRVTRAVAADQQRTGKTLDFDARQKIVDAQSVVATDEGFFSTDRLRLFEARIGQEQVFSVDDVEEQAVELGNALGLPAESLARIAAALDEADLRITEQTLRLAHHLDAGGVPVTKANIIQLDEIKSGAAPRISPPVY